MSPVAAFGLRRPKCRASNQKAPNLSWSRRRVIAPSSASTFDYGPGVPRGHIPTCRTRPPSSSKVTDIGEGNARQFPDHLLGPDLGRVKPAVLPRGNRGLHVGLVNNRVAVTRADAGD